MSRKLLDYKTSENVRKFKTSKEPITYFNPYKDPYNSMGKIIGEQTFRDARYYELEAGGNKGMMVKRPEHYDYVVNGTIVTQMGGASIELLEALTRENLENGDYEGKFRIMQELIEKQNATA